MCLVHFFPPRAAFMICCIYDFCFVSFLFCSLFFFLFDYWRGLVSCFAGVMMWFANAKKQTKKKT